MNKKEALELLSNGHSIYSPEIAKEICEVLGIPVDDIPIKKFYSDPPGTFKGLQMNEGMEGAEGIWSLTLSGYIVNNLNVADKVKSFMGKGFQAREYVRVIKESIDIGV